MVIEYAVNKMLIALQQFLIRRCSGVDEKAKPSDLLASIRRERSW